MLCYFVLVWFAKGNREIVYPEGAVTGVTKFRPRLGICRWRTWYECQLGDRNATGASDPSFIFSRNIFKYPHLAETDGYNHTI